MAGRLSYLFEMLGLDAADRGVKRMIASTGDLTRKIEQLDKISSSGNNPFSGKFGGIGTRVLMNSPEALAEIRRRQGTPPIIGGGAGAGAGATGKGLLGLLGTSGSSPFGQGVLTAVKGLAAVGAASFLLRQAIEPVIQAFKALLRVIEQGSKIYTDAARLGRQPGQLFALRGALEAIGIENSDQLFLNAEFGGLRRSGGRGGPGSHSVRGTRGVSEEVDAVQLAALRIGQMGDLQAIRNLRRELDYFVQDSKVDAFVLQGASRTLFEANFELKGVGREFKTAIMQLVEPIAEIAIPALNILTDQLKTFNAVVFLIRNTLAPFIQLATGQINPAQFAAIALGNLTSGSNAPFSQSASGGNQRIPANAMQKIGFVFGNGNYQTTDYNRQTAINTKKTVALLDKIANGPQDRSQRGIASWATNP